MNIALPILLLVFGGLTFWVLNESLLKWYFKTACISVFCVFTIIFWTTIHSFLGWPADEDDIPEKILIHWIIIKEPNKITEFSGSIYILLESAKEKKTNFMLKIFGYSKKRTEPRLYGVAYNRELHEEFEKNIIPKLKKGQPVIGSLTKKKGGAKNRKGKEGEGSESQEQEWQFHELRPSDIHSKPE